MFTIKFYYNSSEYDVLCTTHYNVRELKTENGIEYEVTSYKDFTNQDGVIYRIGNSLPVPHYSYAFIENSQGKTIEHIKVK